MALYILVFLFLSLIFIVYLFIFVGNGGVVTELTAPVVSLGEFYIDCAVKSYYMHSHNRYSIGFIDHICVDWVPNITWLFFFFFSLVFTVYLFSLVVNCKFGNNTGKDVPELISKYF